MLTLRKIGEGISYNLVFKIFNTILALVTSILMVRLLGKNEYGLYLFVMGIFAILTPFYYLGLDSALLRYVPEYKTKERLGKVKALVITTIKIKVITWVFLSSIVLLIWNSYYPDTLNIAILGVIATLIGSIGSSMGISLESFYEIKFINVVGGFVNVIRILLIGIVLFYAPSVENVILVGMVPNIMFIIIFGTRLRKMLYIPYEKINTEFSRIIKYSLSMMVSSFLLYITWSKSEVVFLGIYKTKVDVAVYGVAYAFAQRITDFIKFSMGGLGIISMTDLYVKNPAKLKEGFTKLMKYMSLIAVPLSFYMFMEANTLILFLYGQKMFDAILPFKIFIWIMAISVFGNVLGIVYKVLEKTVLFTKIIGVSALINLTLDLLLIPPYGIYGAVLAVVITLLINSITIFFFAYKLVGNIIPLTSIMKSIISSIPMILILFITNNISKNILFLIFISCVCFITYLLMLKLTNALSIDDKKLIYKLNIPIINYILKFI